MVDRKATSPERALPPDPIIMFEDMSDAMIAIYLEQARQEQNEDEEYREFERVWRERYIEEYTNACSDL